MKKGHFFRILRLEKRMSMGDVSKEILSVAQLSKFERGLSDITLNKFVKVLERIHVTLQEFEVFSNNFDREYLHLIIDKIRILYSNRDTIELEKIMLNELQEWENTKHKYHKYNYVMISIMFDELNDCKKTVQSDIEELIDYLFSIGSWTYYEYIIFGNIISILPIETIIVFINEALENTEFYDTDHRHRKLMIHIIINATIRCLLAEQFSNAAIFLKKMEILINSETYIYEKTLFMYTLGVYLVKTDKRKEGIILIKKAFQILELSQSYSLIESYTSYLKEFSIKL